MPPSPVSTLSPPSSLQRRRPAAPAAPRQVADDWQVVELPPLTRIARHAGRSVFEASLAPMVLFYLLYEHCGLRAALGGALCWQLAMISRRLLRGERMSGMLLGCLVMLLVRCGFAWATGSVVLYLLQPIVGQVLSACAFSGSAWRQRPLAAVFAKDFVPLPPALVAMPHMTAYLCRVSLLFGLASLGQAVTNVLLLTHAGVGATMLAGKAVGSSLTVSAFVVALWWFRRSMRRHRIRLVVPWRLP